jgi:23S rRNA pseudouridine1911/1915/1917 synthase
VPFVEKKFHIDKEIQIFLFLMRTLKLSHGDAQKLVHKGRVKQNDIVVTSPSTMMSGDIDVILFEALEFDIQPIFSTKDFMVFDKPSGVLVHPTNRWTPISMLDAMRRYGGEDANPVHRIDKETSGLLVSSIHKEAEVILKSSFETRDIKKSYLAWVDGKIDNDFEVNEPILKRDNYDFNKHKVEINEAGKVSLTRFYPLEYDELLDATLLRCEPHSGRMHQIRIHLFHVKHPILGDPLYGTAFEISDSYLNKDLSDELRAIETGASRLMLHAQTLEFEYGERFSIESKVDFGALKDNITSKSGRIFNTKSHLKS